MLKEIVIAVQSWGEAHRFIQQHKLFRWIIIPGIIYTLLFIVGMIFFWRSSDDVISWVSSQLGVETWLQKERSEWLSFFFVMTGMMMRLMLFLFYFSLFKYFVLIIGSPLFAYLSEKTEAIIDGKEHSFNWSELKKDCTRSIKLALRSCGWQIVYLIALVILSLIPLAGWITPLIALLMECYYFGFSMLDYSLARNGSAPSQSIQLIGRHKGLAVGNGVVFYLAHIVIIFAPAYAVIAATLTIQKVKTS